MNDAIFKIVLKNLGLDPEEMKAKGNELVTACKAGLVKVNTFERQLKMQSDILEQIVNHLNIKPKREETHAQITDRTDRTLN